MTGRVEHGEVFTRRWVVEALLDLTGYTTERRLDEVVLVEPSIGTGAFLGPIVERLIASTRRHDVALDTLGGAIRGFDVQDAHVEVCRKAASAQLQEAGLSTVVADEMASTWLRTADYLVDDVEVTVADIVVGNPPYIRSDDISNSTEAAYRLRWPTMRGRADIFVGFYEKGLASLKPDGKLGYICADRWMRNAYGAGLRELVGSRYSMQTLWQMHDVDAFEVEVSAYPAITILSNAPQGDVVVANTTGAFGEASARTLIDFQSCGDTLEGVGFKAHRTAGWFTGPVLWPAGDPDRIALLEHLNENFCPLQDPATGTKIGIGVATGADQAYITTTPDVEWDRALPIATTRDIVGGLFKWGGRYLLNPWSEAGKLVDLDEYPRLRAALETHDSIKRRYIAKRNPDTWHRTIDKVNHSLIPKPKLLLQDMASAIHPVLEPGGFYPHHNLYYVISEKWDMKVLGGLLLSRIAQAFVDSYGVKMRGGTMRFQAQYLRMIRVPDPDIMPSEVANALRVAFDDRDADAATLAAERAYGLPEGQL